MRDAKSLIAAAYDRTAADFAALADKLVYRHLAVPLAAAIRDVAGSILDVASGTGALARLLGRAVAVDISPKQLLHNPVESKVAGDAEALPFRTDAFGAAASAFGINHFPRPATAVTEMARVAPVVGLLTWAQPEDPYAPRDIVLDAVERHAGRYRTEAGDLIDEMTERTGSIAALRDLLGDAGLAPQAEEVVAEVPWPGTEAFLDYRVTMTGVADTIDDLDAVRAEAAAAIEALRPAELVWHPRLILAVGRR